MTEWPQIIAAVTLALSGERDAGRRELLACWQATGETDHAQRCVLAHYLADVEPEVSDEVRWDERALAAFEHVVDADLAPIGIASADGFAPSLHLNLGDGYLRLGRIADARAHLDAGLAGVQVLAEDGYAALVRKGLEGLEQRVAGAQVDRP